MKIDSAKHPWMPRARDMAKLRHMHGAISRDQTKKNGRHDAD
ncbi:MAG TPA: hypothetical protein VN685_11850 [Rhizomicrobium sp.]|nr:hypothetical protein [Rhizomicrobium sp.]